MKRVLVTGGAGFIGSHLCETLLNDEYAVFCLDNFNDYYDSELKRKNISEYIRHQNFTLLESDIRDYASLQKILENNTFDQIVHLAARAGVIPSVQDPIATFENNVIGTQNILEPRELYELTGQVPNVVFPSGMIVEDYDEDGYAKDNSEVKVYYGAADTSIGLATSTIDNLIEQCYK